MKAIPLLAAVVSLVLCSCGGSAATSGSAGASSGTTSAAVTTRASVAAVTAPGAATSTIATTANATSASATSAASTSSASTTAVPTAAPPAASPVAPKAVSSTSSAAAAASGAGSSGACDSLYYPVQQGAKWVYRSTGTPTLPDQIETITSVTPNSFVRHVDVGGKGIDLQWTCSADGETSGQFTMPSTGPMQVTGTATKVTGISIPPAAKWAPGYSWTTSYTSNMHISTGSGQSAIVMDGVATVKITNTIVSKESVQVLAGTFEAYKVTVDLREDITMSQGGAGTPPISIDVPSTAWYAPNVGMVKQTTSGGSAPFSLELVSYSA